MHVAFATSAAYPQRSCIFMSGDGRTWKINTIGDPKALSIAQTIRVRDRTCENNRRRWRVLSRVSRLHIHCAPEKRERQYFIPNFDTYGYIFVFLVGLRIISIVQETKNAKKYLSTSLTGDDVIVASRKMPSAEDSHSFDAFVRWKKRYRYRKREFDTRISGHKVIFAKFNRLAEEMTAAVRLIAALADDIATVHELLNM